MKIRQLIRLTIAAAAITCSASAFAQWTVYDPVNWVQNMTSARSAVSNEINTAQALIQQINAAKSLARSTAGLTNLSGLTNIGQAQSLYQALINVDSRLSANLDNNAQLADNLRAQYGASNMSWDQFTAARSQMDAQQRQINRDRYTAITQSMNETSSRRQEIVSQLSQVQGQTQAMQSLGAALDVIIGQNQQILGALMANSKIQDSKQNSDAAAAQIANNQRALYQQQLLDTANKY